MFFQTIRTFVYPCPHRPRHVHCRTHARCARNTVRVFPVRFFVAKRESAMVPKPDTSSAVRAAQKENNELPDVETDGERCSGTPAVSEEDVRACRGPEDLASEELTDEERTLARL